MNLLAINKDPILRIYTLTNVRLLAIDLNQARINPTFDSAARAYSLIRQ